MSRLGFANVGEAFMLGSDQIKNTQEEIAKLKALISDSSIQPKVVPVPANDYQRIGPAPQVTATFGENVPSKNENENFDILLSKLIQHPRFDDIVKNYVDFKHPEWVLKETKSAFGINDKLLTNLITFLIIIILLNMLI